ncbi:cingulin-like isoform X1 [Papaver somniferum]|nr:cingulin-like isoform X1 [Papaver somniferum]
MEERLNNNASLISRIQQLEQERDALHKDIEQLCMQQSGPGFLAIATRLHFQRTAGLEQDIENLRKKLLACTRDNHNLQEELSEVYKIKNQLADLHSAEASKHLEAEKQLKFFQGCVASAFAERDHSIMEAEKAKETEEAMLQKLNDLQERVQELTSEDLEEKKRHTDLQIESVKLKEQNELFKQVIDKFFEIRQSSLGVLDDCDFENKCEYLLRDDPEMWSFDEDKEASTSSYIVMLEKELESLNNSVGSLRNQAAMGLDIEDHLKKKVRELEKEKILLYDAMKSQILELRHFHTQNRFEVTSFLEQEKNQFNSILDAVQERIQFQASLMKSSEHEQTVAKLDDLECRDVHITTDTGLVPQSPPALPKALGDEVGDTSDALAQALQEKVSALLLLSQQDERQLLERNVNAALQEKMDELQKNLLQVTNEKVKALLELAQLRQEYQVLQEDIIHERKQGNHLADTGEKNISTQEREVGKLTNLLKKTYLSRWVGRQDPNETGGQTNNKSNNSVDYARLRVENATLKESIETMEHLTSSIHRLRLSLVKAKDSSISLDPVTDTIQALNDVINEAKLIKTALGSSLPVSWSSEAENETQIPDISESSTDTSSERPDFVSTSGLEMVELLILAAQTLVANVNLLSVLPSQHE